MEVKQVECYYKTRERKRAGSEPQGAHWGYRVDDAPLFSETWSPWWRALGNPSNSASPGAAEQKLVYNTCAHIHTQAENENKNSSGLGQVCQNTSFSYQRKWRTRFEKWQCVQSFIHVGFFQRQLKLHGQRSHGAGQCKWQKGINGRNREEDSTLFKRTHFPHLYTLSDQDFLIRVLDVFTEAAISTSLPRKWTF